ncbi:aminoglycoside phosphotransferase family protein [Lysinibacillus sphaericus]|uniref:Aminoglycoside phosphotransferase family protein n=1 Tax=Lysinibacillus sphaericus TaxID=1421 RepID=A0A544V0X6_LYSSH|nr:aminoglycoside phosphotransferase family protein [Lysinibacillus sp. SDF0037]TQR39754.1 aminoglycoside phosphotransferase family protein [Lysinibacillus sp. SDF0037]
MDYFLEIVKEFDIPTITNETLLTNGKTASTFLLHTKTSEKYILKSVDTKEQAYFEYKLIQHIRTKNKNIVSEILTSKFDGPFTQIDKNLFQIQVYVPSVNEKAPLQKVLNTYQMLQEYLRDFHYEPARHNRFALDRLWIDTKELLHENLPKIYDELCPSIEKLMVLDHNQTKWIHGDLGAWNILLTAERNVCFIDFSEARKGPRYFDLVAIFASYLPQNLEEIDTYTQVFLAEYDVSVNLNEFYQTLELWYVKGILSLLKVDTQSTKEHILYFYKIIKYIRSL